MQPRALLLDEPFVSLDPASRRDLAAVLSRLAERGTTVVLATHDVDAAWSLCDEAVVLAGGRVVSAGPWVSARGAAAGGGAVRAPLLVELWRRLGRDAAEAPRTAAQAAEALA